MTPLVHLRPVGVLEDNAERSVAPYVVTKLCSLGGRTVYKKNQMKQRVQSTIEEILFYDVFIKYKCISTQHVILSHKMQYHTHLWSWAVVGICRIFMLIINQTTMRWVFFSLSHSFSSLTAF